MAPDDCSPFSLKAAPTFQLKNNDQDLSNYLFLEVVVHYICICYPLAMKCLPPLFCSAQRFLLWNHTLPKQVAGHLLLPGSSLPWTQVHYTPITPNELLVYVSSFSRTLSFLSTNSLLLISITLDKYQQMFGKWFKKWVKEGTNG